MHLDHLARRQRVSEVLTSTSCILGGSGALGRLATFCGQPFALPWYSCTGAVQSGRCVGRSRDPGTRDLRLPLQHGEHVSEPRGGKCAAQTEADRYYPHPAAFALRATARRPAPYTALTGRG